MSGAGQITPPRQSAPPDTARSDITRAIEKAAAASHTPFATLAAIAGAESGFHADARSRMSSAAGPFQITQSTWLHLVKKYGVAAGRPDLASLVRTDATGHLSMAVQDKAAVLDARHDIEFSSRLAARFCDECRSGLTKKLGRVPSEEDVRLAYFLGVNGATRLMTAAAATPGETVSAVLPRAFANHRGLFSHHGHPLNAEQALTTLEGRFATQIAQSGALKSYASANVLASRAIAAADADVAASDAVFTAAAEAATAAGAVAAVDAAAPGTAPQSSKVAVESDRSMSGGTAPVQTTAADAGKPLACKPEPDGSVRCAL